MSVKSAKQIFSERFKLALKELGLDHTSQAGMGKFFGVSGQAVRKWQNAEAMPNSSRAALVAKKLQVRRAWLIDGELPMREVKVSLKEASSTYTAELSLSREELMMIENYRKLPALVQESVFGLIMSIINRKK